MADKTRKKTGEKSVAEQEVKPQTVASAQEQTAVVEESAGGKKKIKGGRHVSSGIAFIHATFNNTKVVITDMHGNVLCWSSAGKCGFKGSKKSTAYVAQLVATDAAKKAQTMGMREAEVRINGPGVGRESAVRGIAAAGLDITALKDITPVPHNGCRPPKRRRV